MIFGGLFNGQYTIGELMRIDSGRQERASACTVELVKVFHELKKESILDKFKSLFVNSRNTVNMYYLIFKLKVVSDKGNTHYVFIRINPDFNLRDWEDNKIKIYCDCQDFKYRSAYVLEKNGSLFLNDRFKIALGPALTDAPKGKTRTTLLCKHSFAAIQWLVSNYYNIMKTI